MTTSVLAAILLIGLVSQAEARSCYYDNYGNYNCNGLYGGTVGGIIVAIVIPIILLIFLATFCLRRRRNNRMMNANNAQYSNNAAYGNPPVAGTYPMAQGGQGYYPEQQQTQYTQPSYAPPQEPQYTAQQQPMYNAPSNGQAAPDYNSNNSYAAPLGPPPQAAGQMGQGEAGKYYNSQRGAGVV